MLIIFFICLQNTGAQQLFFGITGTVLCMFKALCVHACFTGAFNTDFFYIAFICIAGTLIRSVIFPYHNFGIRLCIAVITCNNGIKNILSFRFKIISFIFPCYRDIKNCSRDISALITCKPHIGKAACRAVNTVSRCLRLF